MRFNAVLITLGVATVAKVGGERVEVVLEDDVPRHLCSRVLDNLEVSARPIDQGILQSSPFVTRKEGRDFTLPLMDGIPGYQRAEGKEAMTRLFNDKVVTSRNYILVHPAPLLALDF